MNTIKLVIDKSGIFKKVNEKLETFCYTMILGFDVRMHGTNSIHVKEATPEEVHKWQNGEDFFMTGDFDVMKMFVVIPAVIQIVWKHNYLSLVKQFFVLILILFSFQDKVR